MLFRIVVAQFLGTARVANLAQCLCFNLPDAFAGDVELLANFLQRVRLSILQPETKADDLLSSRGVSVCSTSCNCSRIMALDATSAGAGAFSSSMKSPRWLSSSSPIGVSSDTGSCAILMISRTLLSLMPISFAISAGVGSRPSSCAS